MARELSTGTLRNAISGLHAGDRVLLSGTVYTARDAAHKRLIALMEAHKSVPFELNGAVIYYCGSTPAPTGLPIGACGPTTSERMDPYTPRLLHAGVCATVGKGARSAAVTEAIRQTGSIYFCAIGGAGALSAEHIVSCETIAFDDLGCEAVRRLEFCRFPLIVGIDNCGHSIFDLQ